jgi:hypothetical protein
VLGDDAAACRSSLVARFVHRQEPPSMPMSHHCEDNTSTSAAQSNQHDGGMSATSSLHSASVMPASLLSSTVASARADANGNAIAAPCCITLHLTMIPFAFEFRFGTSTVHITVMYPHRMLVIIVILYSAAQPMMVSSLPQKCHGFVLAIRAPS